VADNKSARKRRDPTTGRFTAEDETGSKWWGRTVRPALRSPLAVDLKQIFELLGIPIGLLAICLTGWQIYQANIQMEQATAVAIEQRLDTARGIAFDEAITPQERFRALGILASSGGQIIPPTFTCAAGECGTVYGFKIAPSTGSRDSFLDDWRLNGMSITNADLTRVWVLGGEWNDVSVMFSHFRDTKFIQARLAGTSFTGSRFIDTEFLESNLTNANFSAGDLAMATFVRSDVSGIELCNATRNGEQACAKLDRQRTFAKAFYVEGNPPKAPPDFLDGVKFGFVCPADMAGAVIVGIEDLTSIGCKAL
jgi:uncharacterized protein YjbI with pentapeptide repeats